MPYMPLLVLVTFGLLFYRAATYERMTGWVWAIISVGLSAIVMQPDSPALKGGLGHVVRP